MNDHPPYVVDRLRVNDLDEVFRLDQMTWSDTAAVALRILGLVDQYATRQALCQGLTEYVYDHVRGGESDAPAFVSVHLSCVVPWKELSEREQVSCRACLDTMQDITPDMNMCKLMGSCGQQMESCLVSESDQGWRVLQSTDGAVPTESLITHMLGKLDEQLRARQWEGWLGDVDQPVAIAVLDAWPHTVSSCGESVDSAPPMRSVLGMGMQISSGHRMVAALRSAIPLSHESIERYRVMAFGIYLACVLGGLVERLRVRQTRGLLIEAREMLDEDFLQRLSIVKQGRDFLYQLQSGARDGMRAQQGRVEGAVDVLPRLLRIDDLYRRQLAMDLHDEVTARLAAVVFSMGTVIAAGSSTRQDLLERIAQYRAELLDLSQWSRLKSHELHPDVLSQLGLADGIRHLAEEWSTRVGVPVSVRIVDGETGEINRYVSAILYRSLQECLRNVEKHAEATAVTVYLRIDSQWVVIVVTDNGKGLSAAPGPSATSGIGVLGMRERLGILRGSFQIDSSPGGGTRVELIAPRQFPSMSS